MGTNAESKPATHLGSAHLERRLKGSAVRSPADALELIQEARPGAQQPCLHPACTEPCEWTFGRGRPQLFCSRLCRRRHMSARSQVLRDLRAIEEALDWRLCTLAEREQLQSELAIRRWVLARYPALPE